MMMMTHTVFKALTIGHRRIEAWEKCKGKSKDAARSQEMETSLEIKK